MKIPIYQIIDDESYVLATGTLKDCMKPMYDWYFENYVEYNEDDIEARTDDLRQMAVAFRNPNQTNFGGYNYLISDWRLEEITIIEVPMLIDQEFIDTVEQAICVLDDNKETHDDGDMFYANDVARELMLHVTEFNKTKIAYKRKELQL